ncbi:Serine/threonine protein kinase OS=Streptomyces rimosus subsp. rimosus (strain ATCC/ DSM 40260 / JCM 4667 / NRRL 2234) OX=1265868 GN=SRIM_022190 PE=4 SV=1 [Streptomyces rimosus subsp. rimosus]
MSRPADARWWPTPNSPAPTALTSRYVYWLEVEDGDTRPRALHRANLDGSDPLVISPASGEDALIIDGLTVSEDAVTVAARTVGGTAGPGTAAKLWQFSPDGTRRERVSCNGGDQVSPASAGARQVVWIDTTTGKRDLVTRTRPAGTCG